jgi:NadR type nicotinamide-nucleotide adenylyltransferase
VAKRFKISTLKNRSKIIVITGAESTGKSTLTENLASYFNVPFIPEVAREYIENLDRRYNYNDVETIAKIQVEQLKKFRKNESSFIFLDTWLIVTKIWFDVVFKKEPPWLIKEIWKTKVDLFLVCDIDIPWIADPVRENGGEKRLTLHHEYIKTITEFDFPFKIVSGENEERLKNALKFIEALK